MVYGILHLVPAENPETSHWAIVTMHGYCNMSVCTCAFDFIAFLLSALSFGVPTGPADHHIKTAGQNYELGMALIIDALGYTSSKRNCRL